MQKEKIQTRKIFIEFPKQKFIKTLKAIQVKWQAVGLKGKIVKEQKDRDTENTSSFSATYKSFTS